MRFIQCTSQPKMNYAFSFIYLFSENCFFEQKTKFSVRCVSVCGACIRHVSSVLVFIVLKCLFAHGCWETKPQHRAARLQQIGVMLQRPACIHVAPMRRGSFMQFYLGDFLQFNYTPSSINV